MIDIFEIKAVFLDFRIFSTAHSELMIETVSCMTVTLCLYVYMDARKMKSGMLRRTIILSP